MAHLWAVQVAGGGPGSVRAGRRSARLRARLPGRQIGGAESPFRIGAPTTSRPTDFNHDPNDEKAAKDVPVLKFDQVIDFPMPAVNSYVLFRKPGEFYKIMYAAAEIVSPVEADMVLLMGSNSPMKLWLNDRVLATSAAGTTDTTRTCVTYSQFT